MKWEFDGQGEWRADSAEAFPPGDEPDLKLAYRIQVCDDGTFDVSASDTALGLGDEECVPSLATAKELCEAREQKWAAMQPLLDAERTG